MIEATSSGSLPSASGPPSGPRERDSASREDAWSEEELRSWSEDWRAESEGSEPRFEAGGRVAEREPAAPERRQILARARLWSVWLWVMVGIEVAFGLGALAWSFALARVERSPSAWGLFAILVLLVSSALAVTTWNRRGTWRPENASTRAFLELEVLREERKLSTASRILPGFFLFEVALLLPWLYWHSVSGGEDPASRLLPSLAYLAVCTVVLFAGCAFFARRYRRRLRDLEQLHRELFEPAVADLSQQESGRGGPG